MDLRKWANELGLVGGFTAIEAIALLLWFYLLSNATGLGDISVILGTGVLFIGLSLENTLATYTISKDNISYPNSLFLAVTEIIIWTQWLLIVLSGRYSARGIGPALVWMALLLVFQHSAERNLLKGKSPFDGLFRTEAIGTSIMEAVGATLLWVLVSEGYPLLGVLALFVALFIEHGARVDAIAMETDSEERATHPMPPQVASD